MKLPQGIAEKELPEWLWLMLLSREIELREEMLKKQGRGWFQIGGRGHEGLVGAALALDKGRDYFFGHYRDRIFALVLGQTPYEMFLAFFGRAEDPNSAARQMPSHYSIKDARLVSIASPVGSQYLPGAGCAMAAKRKGLGEVAFITSGDGTSNEGEFYEAVRVAVMDQAPAVFLIEDNRFAISTRTADQVAFRIPNSVSTDAKGQTWLLGAKLDFVEGTDPLATHATVKAAVERARGGGGPAVIVASCVRLSSHSSADPDYLYRPPEELKADQARDPVKNFADLLVKHKLVTAEDLARLQKRAFDEAQNAADDAAKAAEPDPRTVLDGIYAPLPVALATASSPEPTRPALVPDKKKGLDMVGALNLALKREMAKNPSIYLYGEDVDDPKGGVFGVTKGLSKTYPGRVKNSPLAEATIVGTGVGMALGGLLPVYEIQFIDYFDPATQQWKAQATTLHWRSNGHWPVPMVIRSTYGGYLPGGAIWHSMSNEALFAHLPGAYIAVPSTPTDGYGLLTWAMRCGNPVLFLEPKHLYHSPKDEYCAEPAEDFVIPFGKARVRREGKHATLVTWGNCVYESLDAAAIVAREDGAEVEVIDLRSIVPLDEETILKSLAKTSRLIVVHEDTRSCGFGAEVVARITGKPETFALLDAPPMRVTRPDVLVPYSPTLEKIVMPHARCEDSLAGGQGHDPALPHDTNIVVELRKLLAY